MIYAMGANMKKKGIHQIKEIAERQGISHGMMFLLNGRVVNSGIRKIISICFLILLTLSLTACVSSGEREKGKEDVNQGKKLIREYVKETYGDKAKVSDLTPYFIARDSSAVPDVNRYARGYVKATVSKDNKDFDILYNVWTNEVLTQEYNTAIQDSFITYANDIIQTANFVNCKMEVSLVGSEGNYISGFLKPEAKTCEDLLSEDISLTLTFRSVNSDFGAISQKEWSELMSSFRKNNTEGQLFAVFVNYEDEKGYEAGEEIDYFEEINYNTSSVNYINEKAMIDVKNIIYADYHGYIQELRSEPSS